MKTLIIGCVGSGKRAMAHSLVGIKDIPLLSLDEIFHEIPPGPRIKADPTEALEGFLIANTDWVIEGCNCELAEIAAIHCDELRFMNPGVEACISRCLHKPRPRKRLLEASEEETEIDRDVLEAGKYEYRHDGNGLLRHREIFAEFCGPKKEYSLIIEEAEA